MTMRLETERELGWLICRCNHPLPRTVTVLGRHPDAGIELTDVYECAHCWRPILSLEGWGNGES